MISEAAMASWFYLSNIKYFDVFGAFDAGVTYWPVSTKVEVGDTLYIYLADPYKQIAFAGEVMRTEIELEEIFNLVVPYIKCETPGKMTKKFVELKITAKIPLKAGSLLSYGMLKEQGLKGRIMWPRKLDNTPDLLSYIKGIVKETGL